MGRGRVVVCPLHLGQERGYSAAGIAPNRSASTAAPTLANRSSIVAARGSVSGTNAACASVRSSARHQHDPESVGYRLRRRGREPKEVSRHRVNGNGGGDVCAR